MYSISHLLQGPYGLREALLIAELIHKGVTRDKYEGLTWEAHTIDLAFGLGRTLSKCFLIEELAPVSSYHVSLLRNTMI
jgi:hypothetical protein